MPLKVRWLRHVPWKKPLTWCQKHHPLCSFVIYRLWTPFQLKKTPLSSSLYQWISCRRFFGSKSVDVPMEKENSMPNTPPSVSVKLIKPQFLFSLSLTTTFGKKIKSCDHSNQGHSRKVFANWPMVFAWVIYNYDNDHRIYRGLRGVQSSNLHNILSGGLDGSGGLILSKRALKNAISSIKFVEKACCLKKFVGSHNFYFYPKEQNKYLINFSCSIIARLIFMKLACKPTGYQNRALNKFSNVLEFYDFLCLSTL